MEPITTTGKSAVRIFPSLRSLIVLLGLTLSLFGAAYGEGVFVPAPTRVDVAYDEVRRVLYISSAGDLIRYDVATNTLLPSLTIGGDLGGMDISPDGQFLAVANRYAPGTTLSIHLVDLAAQTFTTKTFTQAFMEGGAFAVAYASDGSLLVSSQFEGSGGVPLRRYFPATDTTTVLGTVQQDAMLRPNANRTVIAISEGNISSGPYNTYTPSTDTFLRTPVFTGTGWFNYEIGISPDAQQMMIPTYNGTYIADATLALSPTRIGVYAAGQPVGVAYNPVSNVVYFPWAGTAHIYAYSTTTLTQIDDFTFGPNQTAHHFGSNGNHAFQNGRVKISSDGSLMFATVFGGVRYISLIARPPQNITPTVTDLGVQLSWTAAPNATGYRVYRGVLPGQATTLVASGVSGTSTTISGLTNGTTYYFVVATETTTAVSTPGEEVNAVPNALPLPAAGFTATPTDSGVQLAWTADAGATSYNVYRSTTPGGGVVIASGVTSSTYSASSLTNGVTYYFQVAAVNSRGEGTRSAELSATPVPVPLTPTGFTATAGVQSVTLSWNASVNAAAYDIFQGTSPNPAGTPVTSTSGTSITLSGLTAQTTYYFRVTARNGAGSSLPTAQRFVSPTAPPEPVTAQPEDDESSGGGAMGIWGVAALSILGLMRLRRFRRSAATARH